MKVVAGEMGLDLDHRVYLVIWFNKYGFQNYLHINLGNLNMDWILNDMD